MVEQVDDLGDLGADVAFAIRNDEALRKITSVVLAQSNSLSTTHLETVTSETEGGERGRVPPANVRMISADVANQSKIPRRTRSIRTE